MRKVYVDFDDVLCETARLLADIIQAEFGKGVPYDDIHSFDLTETFGLNAAESERLFEIFHDAAVLSQMQPIAGAAGALRQWKCDGVFIHIVTGRPPATCEPSKEWLEKHGIPYDRISFVDKYGRNHAHVDNVDIITLAELREMHFDAAIDDSPVAIEFLAGHTNVPLIIFDRPWNAALTLPPQRGKIFRCKSWDDVLACAARL